jgi:hypothetical protein
MKGALRRNKNKRREWKRCNKFNYHHIKNKTNGGEKIESNLLRLDIERHNAWHFLFGNMSFREVADLLIRVCELKGQQDHRT